MKKINWEHALTNGRKYRQSIGNLIFKQKDRHGQKLHVCFDIDDPLQPLKTSGWSLQMTSFNKDTGYDHILISLKDAKKLADYIRELLELAQTVKKKSK